MHRRPIKDDLADVGAAIAWADEIVSSAGAPQKARLDAQVCLEEALANLIMHGRAGGDKDIALAIAANSAGVEVRISDRCEPFNVVFAPLRHQDPEHPGGLGLRLLRGLASELGYDSGPDGNVLTMRFYEAAK